MKKKKTVSIWLFTLCALLVLAICAGSMYEFYVRMRERETKIQVNALQELAEQETTMVDVKLEGYLSSLHSLAEFMRTDELHTKEHMMLHLEDALKHLEFSRLGLISLDGTLHATSGPDINVSDRSYFEEVLQEKKSVVTDLKESRITGNKIFIVAVPVLGEDGEVQGALHGAVNLADFQAHEGQRLKVANQSAYVIDREGNFILRDANNEDASWKFDTIFEQIQLNGNDMTMEQLQRKLSRGEVVTTELTSDGVEYLTVFTPLNFNNWYTVVALPLSEISSHVNLLLEGNMVVLASKVLGAVGVLCGLIILRLLKNMAEERKKEKSLREGLTAGILGYVEADLDDNRVLNCSEQVFFTEHRGLSLSDYTQKLIEVGVHPDYQENAFKNLSIDHLRELFEKGVYHNMVDFFGYDPDNGIVWVECETHIRKNKENGHLIVTYMLKNTTNKLREERKLKEKAERDGLTGLFNRTTAVDTINLFLRSHAEDSGQHAFIIIDLDNFKRLNDTLGHKTGDKALQDVAAILMEFFRREDIVCRLGGDEFIVFMKYVSEMIVEEKARRLIPRLVLNYSGEYGEEVQISASIGIALTDAEITNGFEDLYHKADEALYEAKNAGKSTFRINRK